MDCQLWAGPLHRGLCPVGWQSPQTQQLEPVFFISLQSHQGFQTPSVTEAIIPNCRDKSVPKHVGNSDISHAHKLSSAMGADNPRASSPSCRPSLGTSLWGLAVIPLVWGADCQLCPRLDVLREGTPGPHRSQTLALASWCMCRVLSVGSSALWPGRLSSMVDVWALAWTGASQPQRHQAVSL